MSLGDPSFDLVEDYALTGMRSVRLKDGQIRFLGSDSNWPKGRVSATEYQISLLVSEMDLLEVWEWRQDYNLEEIGWGALDGFSWKFRALINGRQCDAGGDNAFPSFEDARKSSLNAERYEKLVSAIRQIFHTAGAKENQTFEF